MSESTPEEDHRTNESNAATGKHTSLWDYGGLHLEYSLCIAVEKRIHVSRSDHVLVDDYRDASFVCVFGQ